MIGVAAMLTVSGCGSSSNETAPTVTVTESASTVTATPAPVTSRDSGGTAQTSGSAKPTDDQKVAKKGTMPDVVCLNLQDAQNKIQDHGVFFSRSEDASGKARQQMWDRNWVVVAQRPAAGTKVGEGEAVLSVVKKGEPNDCPNG